MTQRTLSDLKDQDNAEVPAPPYRWGTRLLMPMVIILGFIALFAGSVAKSLKPVIAVKAAPVIEKAAQNRQVKKTSSSSSSEVLIQAAGWVEPAPYPVYAAGLTDGTVEEILFLEGEPVKKNQILVELIKDDAELALQRAQADYEAAQETWDANIESRRRAEVAASQVEETEAALELAKAELEIEQALLDEAERILKRRESLVTDGSISEETFESARAEAKAQAARARVVKSRIDSLEAKLNIALAESKAAQQTLELRTEEKRRLRLAEVARDEAQLRLDRLTIKSPIDGVVMRRLVEPGSMVMAMSENMTASRVAELYNPGKLQVRVDVPLADAANVSVGQNAEIIVEVLPDQTFTGEVTRITNFADIQKNTLEVKVEINNPSEYLKPEMLARVKFLEFQNDTSTTTSSSATSVYAPSSSVQDGIVWVISRFDGEQGIAKRRNVETTGANDGDWTEISQGLNPGDLVVIESELPLKDEQTVFVQEMMENL